MAPVRVLLAVSQLAPCGASDLVLHLVEALDRERFVPSVLGLCADDAPPSALEAQSAGVARFARLGVPARSMLLTARGPLQRCIAPLVQLPRAGDFHVVHAYSRPADLWLTLAGAARTPVHLYTRQAPYSALPLSIRLRDALLARFATRVAAVSGAVHAHLRSRELVPRRRVELVPDGIPFAPVERTRPRRETRMRLGMRFHPYTVGELRLDLRKAGFPLVAERSYPLPPKSHLGTIAARGADPWYAAAKVS
ncbi:MAG TPA: glycosyltransferase family 4 protein [Myxococcota bacterium]|nr:glycosyltransferase family 4 protein [Myxococcota bacterium]